LTSALCTPVKGDEADGLGESALRGRSDCDEDVIVTRGDGAPLADDSKEEAAPSGFLVKSDVTPLKTECGVL